MKLTCFLTVLPFLGRTTQKSINGLILTDEKKDLILTNEKTEATTERTDAAPENWGGKDIVQKTDINVEIQKTLEVEYNLVSLLIDKMVLETLRENDGLIWQKSDRRTRRVRSRRRRSSGDEDLDDIENLLLLRATQRQRRRQNRPRGGRGRGDLIPYPRVG